MTSRLARVWKLAVHTAGSTRSCALIRVGLVATLWSKWADDLALFRHLADGLWPLGIVFYVATTLAFVGLWTRYSMVVSAGCALFLVYYAGFVLDQPKYTHHHTFLLTWACVWAALTPCGVSLSLDRWLAIGRAERVGAPPPQEVGNLWALRLLALQMSAVYFWTGLEKINEGFLSGARLAHMAMWFYMGSDPLRDVPGLRGALSVMAPSVVILELSLAFGLWFARARTWLVPLGLFLHAAFYALLAPETFTVTVWILYLAYADPDVVHQRIDRVLGIKPASEACPVISRL